LHGIQLIPTSIIRGSHKTCRYESYCPKTIFLQNLKGIVKKIISNKRRWLKVMMEEELRLFPEDYDKPGKSAILLGVSAVIGSLIPIIPFFFLTVKNGMIAALGASVAALFLVGVVKARMTEMNWKKSGLELAIIGTLAALVGFGIGKLLGGIYG